MFCNQCGKEIPNEALFCPGCGAKKEVMTDAAQPAAPAQPIQEAPAQPVGAVPPAAPAKKGGFPFKIMIPVAAAFVVLVLVLVVVLVAGKGSDYDTYSKNELMANYEEGLFYVFGDEKNTFEVEEDNLYDVNYSADQSVAAYLSYDDDSDKGFTLYSITAKDLEGKMVAEEVTSCAISYTGEYIAYVQDAKDNEGDLYLYCVKSGDITQIDSDVYAYTYTLSPNGKMIAYLKDYEYYDDNTLYLGGIGKDSVEVDDDGCYPISVTDNGKYLYYMNASEKLYLYDGKEAEKVASDVDDDFYVTNDGKEILFEKDGKTYYHNVKADDTVKVMSDYLYDVILPMDAVYFNSGITTTVGMETFKGAVIRGEYDIYWFNNKGTDTKKICYSTYLYQLSDDGKSFVYVEGGTLYKVDKLSEDMEATRYRTDIYVEEMAVSNDLSKMYVAGEDELYYIKNKETAVEITNGHSRYEYGGYSIAYSEIMKKVFFIEDDTLCYAGTNEKSVKEVEDDVYSVYACTDGGIVFTIRDKDYDYEYYYVGKGDPVELELY